MKKFFQIIIIVLGILLSTQVAFAALDLGTGKGGLAQQVGNAANFDTGANADTLPITIGRIIQVVLAFVGTIFFALAVYAGFLWMTAQGNAEQVDKAVGIIRTAVIGVIIVTAAYSITAFALIFTNNSTSFNNVGGSSPTGGSSNNKSGVGSGYNSGTYTGGGTCGAGGTECVQGNFCPANYAGGQATGQTCDPGWVCCAYSL